MRTLVLMRHAQTEATHPRGDKYRELLSQGHEESARAGRDLTELNLTHALVSSSVRTRQTFEALGLDNLQAQYLDLIYEGSTKAVFECLTKVDDDVSGLLVIGHAPIIGLLASDLARASAPDEADGLLRWFPTATYAVFTMEAPWSQLTEKVPVSLVKITRPAH